MIVLLSAVIAFVVAVVCVPFIKRMAVHYGVISLPRNDRWHKKPVPLLGGVAIYAATVTAFVLATNWDFDSIVIILAGTMVFLLGMVDDFKHLSPPVKLVVEIVVASAIVIAGIRWDITSNTAIDTVITLVWIVGLTNAFNLLDNMDGLSAGIAIITGFFVFLCMFGGAQSPATVLLASLVGSAAGFLVYNFNPASIFMGDSGSLFIGFMLGSIVLVPEIRLPSQLLQIVILPVFIFLIPIFDTSYVVFMRKLSGVDAMRGGKDHTSHRLVKIGLSERWAVVVIYSIGILSGILVYLGRFMPVYAYVELLFLFAILLIFLGIYLSKIKVHEVNVHDRGTVSIIVNVTYKRRIFEIMLDLVIIFVSLYGAYLLRFEGSSFHTNIITLVKSLPYILGIQIASFYIAGVYKGVWKYTGAHEVWAIIKGVVLGVVISMLTILFLWRFYEFSRTVFIIYAILLFILMGLSRYTYKSFDYLLKKNNTKELKRVLIYGAGDSGEFAVNEMLNNEKLGLVPVCFIDDDGMKHGRSIHGYPVIGSIDMLEKVIKRRNINEVIVSTPKIKEEQLNEVKKICEQTNVILKKFSLKIED